MADTRLYISFVTDSTLLITVYIWLRVSSLALVIVSVVVYFCWLVLQCRTSHVVLLFVSLSQMTNDFENSNFLINNAFWLFQK